MKRPVATAALLLLAAVAPGQEPAQEEPQTPAAALSGPVTIGTLDLGRTSVPLVVRQNSSGPLFPLPVIVEALGGELRVGPFEEAHTLVLGDSEFILGPASSAIAKGRELIFISQIPLRSPEGLMVPLDALRKTWGELYNLDLVWVAERNTLEVRRRLESEIPVDLQVVDIQGITTAVLVFERAPRYRTEIKGRNIDVVMVGDRVSAGRIQQPGAESLVRRIEVSPDRVRLLIADDAVSAAPYALDRTTSQRGDFRLVFEVSRMRRPVPSPERVTRAPERRPGVRTIVLDPGHGGAEQGAIGPSGIEEKELTLVLAQALRRKLELRLPVQVLLTRAEDADLPLDTRTALANQNKADLFVSVHLNSAPGTNAVGAETYFLSPQASDPRAQQSADSENRQAASDDQDFGLQLLLWDLAQNQHLAESQRLATLIQDQLNQALGLRDRGVKQAPFRVLMGATMPAVLVELGFLSNPDEEQRLQDPAYRAQLVDAVVAAIAQFEASAGGGGGPISGPAP